MPTQPRDRCDYRIPVDPTGRQLPTAADIALLFPYPTEEAAIHGIAAALTNQYGFTTVSIRFPGMTPEDGVRGGDHKRWYYYPESGSGAAWIEAIRQVRKIGGFPERPLFVTGRSGGGSAAGLFADAYPNLVAALANEAGRIFPDSPHFTGPILIMHGAHDYVSEPTNAYLAKVKGQVSVVRFTYPPAWGSRGKMFIWQHSIYGPAEKAMWRWLADLADMRLEYRKIPSMSAWPATVDDEPASSTVFADLMRQVLRPARPQMVQGVPVTVAVPPASVDAQGLFIIIGTDLAGDQEQLLHDAEFFADHHWNAIAIRADNAEEAVRRLRAVLGLERLARLP